MGWCNSHFLKRFKRWHVDNYRPVTIHPNVSKLFERPLFELKYPKILFVVHWLMLNTSTNVMSFIVKIGKISRIFMESNNCENRLFTKIYKNFTINFWNQPHSQGILTRFFTTNPCRKNKKFWVKCFSEVKHFWQRLLSGKLCNKLSIVCCV